MSIADRVNIAIGEHKQGLSQPEELAQLQEFLCRMEVAGVAKRREYDLPQPDTVGRAVVEEFRNKPIQS